MPRSARLGGLTLALALAFSSGCSLAGLDQLGYVTCSDDAPCDALSTSQGLDLAACTGWQCNDGFCRLVRRDADRDGHTRAACFTDLSGDCDDTSADIHPGASEVCDGRDQDCDLGIDEGTAAGVADEHFVAVAPVGAGSRLLATSSLSGGGVALTLVDASNRGVVEEITSTMPRVPFETSPTLEPALHPDVGLPTRGARCVVDAATRAIPISDACTGDTDCSPGLVCRARPDGRRVCGTFAGTCATDAECGDADLCNGPERCVPGAPEADGRGCAAALSTACTGDELCEARTALCLPTVACDVVDLAEAPADGDASIAASLSDHCAGGSLRLGLVPAGAPPSLRTLGGSFRTPALFAIDADAMDCTGASRAGASGAAGLAIASLPRTPLSQALVAYRSTSTGEARIEILGAWLEADADGESWVTPSGSGIPVVLPDLAAASVTRPAVAAIESPGASGFVVAYARAAGGIALHFVSALPASAPTCPVGIAPTAVCTAGAHVLVPDTVTARRTTPDLGTVSSDHVGTEPVATDVSLALRASAGADAEVAIAFATASEVVVRIGALAQGAFDLSTEHHIAAPGAREVSVTRVGRGLAVPSSFGVPEGGLVVAWHDATASWVVLVRDGEPPSAPLAIGAPLSAPRAAYLDDHLVVIGARPGEIDVVPLTCPMAAP